MSTTFLLVRAAQTLFHFPLRILGRRDLALTPEGRAQAARAAALVEDVEIHEVLSSPLGRAIQTAEVFAQRRQLGIGRDARLNDLDAGKWEGTPWDDVAAEPAFRDFLAGDADCFPDGEELEAARRRAVASIEQAAADSPRDACVLVVTHGHIVQLLIAHYLGMPSACFLRLQLDHASISVLRFVSDLQPPQVLGVNVGVPLRELLAPPALPLVV